MHQQGHIEEAQSLYLNFLQENPNHADALHLLGVCYLQQSQLDKAKTEIKKAIQNNNQIADYWLNLSQAEKLCGDDQAALTSLQTALKINPTLTQAWNNLGNLQQQLNLDSQAVESYNQALSQQPNYANAHYNLSLSLKNLAKFSEAIQHCKRALELEPKNVEYWGQFSNFLVTSGENQKAQKVLEQGLAIHSDNIELSCQLASVLADEGELDHALSIYSKVLLQKADHALAISQWLYLKRSVCDWQGIEDAFNRLLDCIQQQQPYISPFSFLTENSSPQQQLECAKLWSNQWQSIVPKQSPPLVTNSSEKIVIGYVSADYYQHPTAYLAARLFEQHDRSRFKVIAYSNSPDDDSEITQRLKKSFDDFVDIKPMNVDQIVEKIKLDNVDILIDLKGHTMAAATEIFARRAAPIQVNYLGYPGTMGASFIDYIIGDKFVTPLENENDFSEKIVQLDGCYQINDNQRSCPTTVVDKSILGLPKDKFIFGCFNNSWKITPQTFQLWMKILERCPDSVLWLMDRHPKSSFKKNILKHAENFGLDSERIIFAKTAPYDDYLSNYLQLDLFLETFPYNAHTMASDALWMGTPVLSVKGETFCARVGESILNAVELSAELLCEDNDDFVEVAYQLYAAPKRIQKIKQHLKNKHNQLSLFDSANTVLAIEKAYFKMVQIKREGKQPEHIVI